MNSYRSLLHRSRGAHLSRTPVARMVVVPNAELDGEPKNTIRFPGQSRSRSPGCSISLKAFLHLFWLLALASLILSAGGFFSSNILF